MSQTLHLGILSSLQKTVTVRKGIKGYKGTYKVSDLGLTPKSSTLSPRP